MHEQAHMKFDRNLYSFFKGESHPSDYQRDQKHQSKVKSPTHPFLERSKLRSEKVAFPRPHDQLAKREHREDDVNSPSLRNV